MADASLVFNILARDKVAPVLAKVKSEVAAVNDDAVKSVKKLDEAILKSKASAAAFATEYARTGSKEVEKAWRAEQRRLGTLTKMRGEVANLAKESENALKAAGKATGFFAKIAESAGEAGSAVAQKLGQAISSNPYIAAGVAAAIVIGLPTIGAALNAALLAGLGGGALAAGILLAARSGAVRAAWKSFGQSALADLTDAASVFIMPMIRSADILHQALADIMPGIRQSFANLAPIVERLATGFGGFLRNMMPGLTAALREAGPILATLADHLPRLGQAMNDFFASIARGGPGARLFLNDLLSFVEMQIVAWGHIIEVLSKAYLYLRAYGQALSGDLTGAAVTFGQAGLKSTDEVTTGLEHVTGAADDTAAAMENAKAKSQALFGSWMNLDQAQNQAAASLAAFKQGLHDNGTTLDINTEKGRANRDNVLARVNALEQQRQSEIAAGVATDVANGRYEASVGALRASMIAAGMNRAEVDKLIAKYLAVPGNLTTHMWLLGAQSATEQILGVKTQLNALKDRTVTITTVYDTVTGQQYNRIHPGARFYRYGGVHYARSGLVNLSGTAGIFSAGSTMYGFAEAGTGGEAFIARNAPDAESLRYANIAAGWHGGTVVPKGSAWNSARMASSSSAGGAGVGELDVTVRLVDDEDRIVKIVRKRTRIDGQGNVQAAFGKRA